MSSDNPEQDTSEPIETRLDAKEFMASLDTIDLERLQKNQEETKQSAINRHLAKLRTQASVSEQAKNPEKRLAIKDRLAKLPKELIAIPYFSDNIEVVFKYLEYTNSEKFLAQNSLERNYYTLKNFAKWYSETYEANLIAVDRKAVAGFQSFLETRNSHRSVYSKMHDVNRFTKWLYAEGYTQKEVKFAGQLKIARKAVKYKRHVPNPPEVFMIRKTDDCRLDAAAMFEVLLSSGMRSDEVTNVRACDINFGVSVLDKETKEPSKFIGGSIIIGQTQFKTKTRQGRKVYFSSFAAKLLKKWLVVSGISHTSKLPIFPYSRKWMSRWIGGMVNHNCVKSLIKERYRTGNENIRQESDEEMIDLDRMAGFMDLKPEDLTDASTFLKRQIENRQGRADKTNRGKGELETFTAATKIRDIDVMGFGPHCLRHLFASLMYWRSYNGERNNILIVSKLLGHTGIMQTEKYLRRVHIIDNDLDWERMMGGMATDWVYAKSIR